MKIFLVCLFVLFNFSAAFAHDDVANNRNDRNLYEKNKMRLQEKRKREQTRNRYYYPDDPNNPNYHREYYYEHRYEEPEYYE